MSTFCIRIKGLVQGVGFRPFIYNLAHKYKLNGTVNNDSKGVLVHINCSGKQLEKFIGDINLYKPDLAHIDTIEPKELEYKEYRGFKIIQSSNTKGEFTLIPSDISICDDCKRELNDPSNRRYKYPFITCTNCGPRYTVINKLPYDRCNTSMEQFPMCEECQKEYNDPSNRRYHAQTIGCFDCGPVLHLRTPKKALELPHEEIIEKTVELIKQGKIIAVKGVGGYHLVCDATNYKAVQNLRERKNRPHKPLAVMVKDIDMGRKLAHINNEEEKLLSSKERPIVVLKTKNILASNIAPGIDKIGLFLPYTPLHELLLKGCDTPLVATSANISGEPLCIDFKEVKRLYDVWDYCLDHNRDILNPCDDSVAAAVKNQVLFLRRGRGYAPKAIKLPFKLIQNVLTLGANQKSTVAFGFDDNAILSSHIGDLRTIHSIEFFKHNINTLGSIYGFNPETVVCDKHPGYESTKFADGLKKNRKDLKVYRVQHHFAHVRAVMIEKQITQKVLGIAFDGTGYGDDGNLWGGEFFICDLDSYERVGHINYFKLLGGEKAIKEPRRAALSLLLDSFGKDALKMDHPTIRSFGKRELDSLYLSWEKELNAPLSSSMGRLFDAVASLTDVIHTISYEGQSGAMLESFYDKTIKEFYEFNISEGVIDIIPMIKAICIEGDSDGDKVRAISKFFNTIVEIIVRISKKHDLNVVLSGGVFQNKVLLELVLDKIPDAVFGNEVPPNDGGISLGQMITGKEND